MKEDVVLFSNAESAYLSDRVERCSSLDHLPFDVVGDVVPLELSDICTECGSFVILILCVNVKIMLVKPSLHGVIG